MSKEMLIDASHSEETRVAVIENGELVEYQHEISNKLALKGNIYLAKVIRVEPSLQAAFVDYGGNRDGFLGFSDIHPDYYKIPVNDRKELLNSVGKKDDEDLDEMAENATGDFDLAAVLGAKRFRLKHRYKIQEVIKRGQVMLVQAVKEERGNKGAAMTTFISLAGRYCVLMPNSGKGGGISRRISDDADRDRLKDVVESLDIPDSMALILRTAGAGRTKAEIKRDYGYLSTLWDNIRQKTIDSQAPALVNEDATLLWHSIRDIYDKDTDKIIISGDEALQKARDYMKHLVPTHVKRITSYGDKEAMPLFQKKDVEALIASIYSPNVNLPSGGYIVIEPTEAMVSIDVNSGRATQERNIEDTAFSTNMEAAVEVARQLRLRDLSGLIVIDFIDMEDRRNNHALERHFKEALRKDRARMHINRISSLGLLEMTRQRLNPSITEVTSKPCAHCYGTGKVLGIDATALMVMRNIEEEAIKGKGKVAVMSALVSLEVAVYIFNIKRQKLQEIETSNQLSITIDPDQSLPIAGLKLYTTAIIEDGEIVELSVDNYEELFNNYDGAKPKISRRSRGGNRGSRNQRDKDYSDDDDARDTANDNQGRQRGASSGRQPSRNPRGSNKAVVSEAQKKKGLLWRILG
ncbi:MAG: Rne/Rng family ribonuclease [Alphaproteobacteria bacterium]|nr:Rne/Rng family ribonuclease [Alphaproteobacteria bacterium]